MASIAFYLLGEDASITTEVEVPRTSHFEDVQHLVASHFSIVDPKGKSSVASSKQQSSPPHTRY